MNRLLLLLLLPCLLIAGCRQPEQTDSRPLITVTILPYRWFAEQLAGDHFRINVLVPPGVSHHNYDPSPKQLRELEKSGVLFINGQLGFELAWLPKLRSNYKSLMISDLSAGISLLNEEESGTAHTDSDTGEHGEHGHGGSDPHYWISVKGAKIFSATMAKALIQADPSCRQLVEGNLVRLLARLDSLDGTLAKKFASLQHRDFFIFHPALTYLADEYQLRQHSMEQAGKEPTASHFRELVDLASKVRINTIFIQREYDQENALTLARETGSQIVVIDPMSGDWLGEMEALGVKMGEMDGRK